MANQKLSTSPLLMNPRQAAAMLGISPRTLWALTDRREIPAVRVGVQWRYSASALAEWVEEQGQRHLQKGGEG